MTSNNNFRKKIKFLIYNLNYKFLLRNFILFESNPDFSDNTRAVFDEMVKRNVNDKYKLIWIVKDKTKFLDVKIKNVKFFYNSGKLLDRFVFMYYNFFSKCIIDCNKYINKINKYQFRINLTHGAPLKLTYNYCSAMGNVDYITRLGEFFLDIDKKLYKLPKNKILYLGYPRNDELFKPDIECFKEFLPEKFNKIILWMPTFRNHNADKNNSCGKYLKYGVPSIRSEEQINDLNNLLKNNETFLLIKLHPAEDETTITKLNLSNIIIVKDEWFEKKHKTVYNLCSLVDALITDYSSIYYDFLLLNKPIGLAIEDIEKYKSVNKLLFEKYEGNIVGEYIYNYNDIINFVKNVINGTDICKEERNEKKLLYHKYIDNNSSKRVVDFILDKMKEKGLLK